MLPDFLVLDVIESSLPEFLPINEYRRQRHAPRHRWWQMLSSHKLGGTIA
jgi:hypothetical protein